MDREMELLAFEEKIALSRLEEAKAHNRVMELEYQKARFCLDFGIALRKEQQKKS